MSAAALTLVYEHDATQGQVAAQLGLTEPQIKSIVADGLRSIAALLCPIAAQRDNAEIDSWFARRRRTAKG